jgi:hypothetical protein
MDLCMTRGIARDRETRHEAILRADSQRSFDKPFEPLNRIADSLDDFSEADVTVSSESVATSIL